MKKAGDTFIVFDARVRAQVMSKVHIGTRRGSVVHLATGVR
jgi:hypothetical protein